MEAEAIVYYKDRITKAIKASEDEKQLRIIWVFIRTYLAEKEKAPESVRALEEREHIKKTI